MGVITFARSSYMGTHKICAHRAMIEYMLGKKPPADALERYGELDYMRAEKAASKGSAVHKALEVIGRAKKCKQEKINHFYDDELDKNFNPYHIDYKQLLTLCIDKYKEEPQMAWHGGDIKHVKDWFWKVIDSDWNPSRCNIYDVEKFFDITIEEDWAKYSYEIGNDKLEGHYKIRGTIDLIVNLGNNTLSIRDWKTGRKTNYAKKGQPDKTYKDLCNDHQFLLYYYVGKKLFPLYDIIVEVNFIRADGISTLFMNEESYKKSYKNLVDFFATIRENYPPTPIKYKNTESCGFCPWNQLKENGSSKTDCEFYEEVARKHSAEELVQIHGDISSFSRYSGGGSERDLS